MDELQKKILIILTKVNKSWEDKIKEAQDNETELELLGMNSEFSTRMEELNLAFTEFKERMAKKKKGGFW